ncbi:hypothetical protein K438DRAFT_1855676 [Mycena galopus ATCC 62051]|nr:hypothetical protein K438DRAFT_1855676 [Mycena galopus ATCC 62051]
MQLPPPPCAGTGLSHTQLGFSPLTPHGPARAPPAPARRCSTPHAESSRRRSTRHAESHPTARLPPLPAPAPTPTLPTLSLTPCTHPHHTCFPNPTHRRRAPHCCFTRRSAAPTRTIHLPHTSMSQSPRSLTWTLTSIPTLTPVLPATAPRAAYALKESWSREPGLRRDADGPWTRTWPWSWTCTRTWMAVDVTRMGRDGGDPSYAPAGRLAARSASLHPGGNPTCTGLGRGRGGQCLCLGNRLRASNRRPLRISSSRHRVPFLPSLPLSYLALLISSILSRAFELP